VGDQKGGCSLKKKERKLMEVWGSQNRETKEKSARRLDKKKRLENRKGQELSGQREMRNERGITMHHSSERGKTCRTKKTQGRRRAPNGRRKGGGIGISKNNHFSDHQMKEERKKMPRKKRKVKKQRGHESGP